MSGQKVAVIGAGIGGLTAAARLADAGAEVTVFEAADEVGGKIGRAAHHGVRFDTGPSLLTMPWVFAELFEACGERFEDSIELVRLDPAFEYRWPDGASLLVRDELEATIAAVRAAFGARASAEFASFMEYARRIWEAALPNFVAGPAPELGGVLRLGLARLARLARIDPLRTMAAGIERQVREPHLRDLLMRYATYNGSDPRRAPATLNCISWVEMGEGGWGVAGGMHALPRALRALAERCGARFEFGQHAERIELAHGRVSGVRFEGGRSVLTDAVVANADVAHLARHLLEDAAGVRAPLEPSMSGWNAVLAGDDAHLLAPHVVLFPNDYGAEFADIFDRDRPPAEPTVYLCAQRLAHRRTGWSERRAPLFLMANAPCEPDGARHDERVWEELGQRVLDRARSAGLIGRDAELVWTRTPAGLARAFPGSRGALYGGASNSPTAAFRRPPNRARLPGLYLASGSAHPGGGVPMCALSGKQAAAAAIEDGVARLRPPQTGLR